MLKVGVTSKYLARDCSEMLFKLKIKHYLRVTSSKKKNRKDCYHIEVWNSININKWFDIIGSKNPKHLTKYLVWKKFGFCPPRTSVKERNKFLKGELNPKLSYL